MATKRTPRARKLAEPDDAAAPVVESLLTPPRGKGLVFISHDSRDADLAEAFSNLLTDVSAGVLKSFRASDKKGTTGIAFGTEWYRAIMSQIGASDVVALLTTQSIERPWILYEAGVAKGKLETTVLGIALGAPLEMVSTGPFGQFQNCGDDEDSLTKLVMQLLGRNPDAAPREEAVRMQVNIFREKVQEILSATGKEITPTSDINDEQDIAKLFEEIKEMVRDLPERVDDRVHTAANLGPFRGGRRFHPVMLEDIISHPRFSKDDDSGAVGLLILISVVRDSMPWLYEAGMELYRSLRSGSDRAVARARQQLVVVLRATDHPMFWDAYRGGSDKEEYMMMRELPQFIEHHVRSIERRLRIGRTKVDTANLQEPDDRH